MKQFMVKIRSYFGESQPLETSIYADVGRKSDGNVDFEDNRTRDLQIQRGAISVRDASV